MRFERADGWAVLRHQFHDDMFVGVIAMTVLGFLFKEGEYRPVGVVTAAGVEAAEAPLLGPFGEVTLGGIVFPNVDAYCLWFDANHA